MAGDRAGPLVFAGSGGGQTAAEEGGAGEAVAGAGGGRGEGGGVGAHGGKEVLSTFGAEDGVAGSVLGLAVIFVVGVGAEVVEDEDAAGVGDTGCVGEVLDWAFG